MVYRVTILFVVLLVSFLCKLPTSRWFNQTQVLTRRPSRRRKRKRLLSAHWLYGNKWALIARLFLGRTDNDVNNHLHVIIARRHMELSNAIRRRKPSNSISSFSSAIAFDKGLQVIYCNNACIVESTISSNRDESLSSGTGLSLDFSQYKARSSLSIPRQRSRS
ncbi:transcription factor CSA-like [Dendrobium catenatum]|uniref:transcription factor CSA-like n=1 Tax=Dendrobium catenatum TaxID=906689 RepID=UPI0009F2A683|nr:transcription factor CSA-like [Dendrobium catenatum]